MICHFTENILQSASYGPKAFTMSIVYFIIFILHQLIPFSDTVTFFQLFKYTVFPFWLTIFTHTIFYCHTNMFILLLLVFENQVREMKASGRDFKSKAKQTLFLKNKRGGLKWQDFWPCECFLFPSEVTVATIHVPIDGSASGAPPHHHPRRMCSWQLWSGKAEHLCFLQGGKSLIKAKRRKGKQTKKINKCNNMKLKSFYIANETKQKDNLLAGWRY